MAAKDNPSPDALRDYCPFGFATSAAAWRSLAVNELLAAEDPFAPQQLRYTLRKLASSLASHHADLNNPAPAPHAEELVALGVITDALRYLAQSYCLSDHPGIIDRGRDFAGQRIGPDSVAGINPAFGNLFPPGVVQAGRFDWESYLGQLDVPVATAQDMVTLEVILLFLTMRNPATRSCRELFDDDELKIRASYVPFVISLEEFFASEEPARLTGSTLFQFLRAPMLAAPDSLDGQLAFIRDHWAGLLPDQLMARLDRARDLLREVDLHRVLAPGSAPVLEFGPDSAGAYDGYPEPESFSRDADWMSNLVLLAKSVYVWLDQLSRWYQRPIQRLDEIPDEELDKLAHWGVTGLWLIGLWERSRASQQIKQRSGNPEAMASAYSLADYEIAGDLGGGAAYATLRDRAAARGIRLASDMVPNHMGIDSRWVVEHPDWFLQLPQPPYPVYSYTGGDLCADQRVSVRIEDGYWERRDAAVVFQRVDNHSGDVRYIYHGNDGTSMPWNDTAQLDFTRSEVREAVIQTILRVARQFPIIRFDAAMTLAKKHYQRLWFPAPGDAGAIPSRAEHGLSRADFDALMPVEFWREVVDRVAAELPDTLLLAEAFWLMEGYFVRTLGMHRVYNSAFMNMLKMEENQKYRQTIKNVLEFSPEVLKRFVNFMNNPDERTAVEQFGKGDKYFGVALMMVTMPGLPMLGHGQIEGFSEKYGMEYRRAYWDEQVDQEMVRRHEREIFPVMRLRPLFSSAENFAIFDCERPDGSVDENVFAYANRRGSESALILYNNAFAATGGRVRLSSAVNVGSADEPQLVRRSLVEALDLSGASDGFYAFRDAITGLEYLRPAVELNESGLWVNLGGYQYHALLEFRHLSDAYGAWARVHDHLGGRGTPSLAMANREIELAPLLNRFSLAIDPEILTALAQGEEPPTTALVDHPRALTELAAELLPAAAQSPTAADAAGPQPEVGAGMTWPATIRMGLRDTYDPVSALLAGGFELDLIEGTAERLGGTPGAMFLPLVWIGEVVRWIAGTTGGAAITGEDGPGAGRLDDTALALLTDRACGQLEQLLGDGHAAWERSRLATLLAVAPSLIQATSLNRGGVALQEIANRPEGRDFLGLHRHENARYFRKEALDLLLAAEMYREMPAVLSVELDAKATTDTAANTAGRANLLADLLAAADHVAAVAAAAGYRLDETIAALENPL